MDQINQLKEQILMLQQNEKDYQDLNFLFTNLEHRYNLLAEEKQRMEIDYNHRHEFNMQAVARHRAEIDQLRNELISCQNNQEQMEYLGYENETLTDEVNNLREAYTKIIQQQVQDQDEKYLITLAAKQQYIESLQFQIKQMNDIQTHKDKKCQAEDEIKQNYVSEMESYKFQNEKLSIDNKQLIKQIERLELQIQNYKDQLNQMTQELERSYQIKNQKTSAKEYQLDHELKSLKNMNIQLIQKNDHQQKQIEQLIYNNQSLIIEYDTLRIQFADQENSKLMVQNQYAKSLNKFQEERKVKKITYKDKKYQERLDYRMKMMLANVQKKLLDQIISDANKLFQKRIPILQYLSFHQ
ncbi:unnamed protein product [Paramecium pentaurelia]|uniref:Uncharacterized protein n=1 Tax=Paramecium pentaurelia TaxID=43138 RepID=A0A8S1UUL9_9CILI|nr:unnamed protein product [Paramecium pentaurelia]